MNSSNNGGCGELRPHDAGFWAGFGLVSAAWFPMLAAPLIFIALYGRLKAYHVAIGGVAFIAFVPIIFWTYRKSTGLPEQWVALSGFRRGMKAVVIGLSGEFVRRARTAREGGDRKTSQAPAWLRQGWFLYPLAVIVTIGWLWWFGVIRF